MKTFEITMTTTFKTTIEVHADDIDDVHDSLEAGRYDTELAEAEMKFESFDSRESEYDVMEVLNTPEEDIQVHLNKLSFSGILPHLRKLTVDDFDKLDSGEEKEICQYFSIYKSTDEDWQTWDIFYTYGDEWHNIFSCWAEDNGKLGMEAIEDWTILKACAKIINDD